MAVYWSYLSYVLVCAEDVAGTNFRCELFFLIIHISF